MSNILVITLYEGKDYLRKALNLSHRAIQGDISLYYS